VMVRGYHFSLVPGDDLSLLRGGPTNLNRKDKTTLFVLLNEREVPLKFVRKYEVTCRNAFRVLVGIYLSTVKHCHEMLPGE
jgi:hypothetical protein